MSFGRLASESNDDISRFAYVMQLFSSAETAFSSVNKIRLKHYAEKKYRGSKKALHIAEHFEQTLSTILVGNVVVNIAASSLAAKIALRYV